MILVCDQQNEHKDDKIMRGRERYRGMSGKEKDGERENETGICRERYR